MFENSIQKDSRCRQDDFTAPLRGVQACSAIFLIHELKDLASAGGSGED
jgi:hypothetical protein